MLAILPLLPGYFASRAYLKFLNEADELLRNVHYEAASKSFILVILLGIVYTLASQVFGEWEDAGAILMGDRERRLSNQLPACLETL